MDAAIPEKLSLTAPMNFRPGPALVGRMSALVTEVASRGGRITPTEIVRDGLLGCWDQVRTCLLTRHTAPSSDSLQAVRLLAISSKALEQGVTPEQIEAAVSDLIEQRKSIDLEAPATGVH